jgi:hypothetical protein
VVDVEEVGDEEELHVVEEAVVERVVRQDTNIEEFVFQRFLLPTSFVVLFWLLISLTRNILQHEN